MPMEDAIRLIELEIKLGSQRSSMSTGREAPQRRSPSPLRPLPRRTSPPRESRLPSGVRSGDTLSALTHAVRDGTGDMSADQLSTLIEALQRKQQAMTGGGGSGSSSATSSSTRPGDFDRGKVSFSVWVVHLSVVIRRGY